MDNLVRNERIKLAANAIDRLSTALASVGVFAPIVALIYGTGTISLTPQFSMVAAACWLLAALGLHLVAKQLLGVLADDRI